MAIGRKHALLARISGEFCLQALCRSNEAARVKAILAAQGKQDRAGTALKHGLVFWLVIAMALHRELSIPNVLAKLIEALRGKHPGLSRREVTDGAISHARERLGVAPLRDFFCATAADIPREETFHGLRPMAIDGTVLTLPDTPENAARFPRTKASRGRTAWPQLRVVTLTDVATHGVLDVAFGDLTKGEREASRPLMESLGENDLLLRDRGFFSKPEILALTRAKRHFLTRMPKSIRYRVIRVLARGDCIIEVKGRRPLLPGEIPPAGRGSKAETGKFRIKMRMICYRIRGERERVWLVTDLLDTNISARELALLYHRRWEAELVFDELKTHLSTVTHGKQRTFFRSRGPIFVEQELWATLATYNLIRGYMRTAAASTGLDPLRLSFIDSVAVLRDSCAKIQNAPTRLFPRLHRQLITDLVECELDRYRRARVYPRVVKVKMSKFRCKHLEDRPTTRDIQRDLLLVTHRAA